VSIKIILLVNSFLKVKLTQEMKRVGTPALKSGRQSELRQFLGAKSARLAL
jgi:hypothetical protein